MARFSFKQTIGLIALMGALLAGSFARTTPSGVAAGQPLPVALPGYHVSLFARGTATYFKPDSVDSDGSHVFVSYQNKGNATGTNHVPSTIVEYSMSGQVLKTFSVPEHNDGMRIDPMTHLLWVSSNEDANAKLFSIDTTTGAMTRYQLSTPLHGGGYDDIEFLGGHAYIMGSNPALNKSGVNTGPVINRFTISGGAATMTPLLMGNAMATDIASGSKVALNEVDPDSLTIDPAGDLVLDNQGGSELVFLHHPGTSSQTVSRLQLGTQVDDSVWTTAPHGLLLVVDGKQNAIYAVTSQFVSNTIYTEAPGDSGVAGFVGTVDRSTGTISPVIIGLGSPTGLMFVPTR